MTGEPPSGLGAWSDAALALTLLAIDPTGLGGANIRAAAGPVRDGWMAALTERLAVGCPVRRVPAGVPESRLLGGLDLAATLAAGRPVAERGLLAACDGGVLVFAMAERMSGATAAHVAAMLDTGIVRIERDGMTAVASARCGVLTLDEGIGDDERVPVKVMDRLAFHLDLTGVAPRDMGDPLPDLDAVADARRRLPQVEIDDAVIEALTATAVVLGIDSVRAVLLAVGVARAAAALGGRTVVGEDDASLAARLVLGPRATRVPEVISDEQADPPPTDPQDPAPAPPEASADGGEEPPPPDQEQTPSQDLADLLLEAATAAIPAGLLARLQQAGAAMERMRTQGRMGVERTALRGGRPAGVRRGEPRQGGRLNLIETLRTAAPWQALRRRDVTSRAGQPARLIEVRRSDFQINRFKQKSETATIFVVDASGSSALNRLAEAKGAVELLLADCYIRRDQVAVIAFRGTQAEVLLPPTRSLVRAKRSLAGLPGGGATPLASALDAAAHLADCVRRKGQTPTLILLTDGRANVARDGRTGRVVAEADALLAARGLRAARVTTLLIDTSPKPQAHAERLAAEMTAVYLPLPYADATRLSAAVRATVVVK